MKIKDKVLSESLLNARSLKSDGDVMELRFGVGLPVGPTTHKRL